MERTALVLLEVHMLKVLVLSLAALTLVSGCRLTLGAGTDVGAGHVGTTISVDPETGDVDQTVGGTVTIR